MQNGRTIIRESHQHLQLKAPRALVPAKVVCGIQWERLGVANSKAWESINPIQNSYTIISEISGFWFGFSWIGSLDHARTKAWLIFKLCILFHVALNPLWTCQNTNESLFVSYKSQEKRQGGVFILDCSKRDSVEYQCTDGPYWNFKISENVLLYTCHRS